MLGYVKVFKPELKVREYEVYCGYYCGICKSIGKRYGQLPRMALSYDAAFLALLLESVSGKLDTPTQEHCVAHPMIKKKTIIRNSAVDYAADVMLILAWYKLIDDANDEGKLYARGTMLAFKRIFKKLRKKHGELCESIEKYLAELSSLENDKCAHLDMATEAFSKIMESIFTEGYKTISYGTQNDSDSDHDFDEDLSAVFSTIGYHMGKWIYLIDAADDIEDNIDTGAYNPLIYRYRFDSASETASSFRKRIEDDLKFNLYHYLAMIGNCLDALEIKKNKGIIENVIYFGLNRKTEEIVYQTDPEKRI